MSVHSVWGLRCPQCNDDSHIDIAATIWVRITSDGTDADESGDGSHEWEDTSSVICRACDHLGTVKTFTTEEK